MNASEPVTLTPALLAACTGAKVADVDRWFAPLQVGMTQFEITTKRRVGMYLANLAHESMRLSRTREIWGPTPSQIRYDPPTTLAKMLGNTQMGDGRRYMGRGPIQITGRWNCANARDKLRKTVPDAPDFEASPELLEEPKWGALVAAWFFSSHGCNSYADLDDFDGVCDLINRGKKTLEQGDANGYYERLQFWMSAQKTLGIT